MAAIPFSKADLLLGKVLKLTKMGMKQVPCAQIRCRRNDYYDHTKMYYVKPEDMWALDKDGVAQVGDTVLIRRSDSKTLKTNSDVKHFIERVVFKFGIIIDPVTQKRCIDSRFMDQIETRKHLIEDIVTGPMAEIASYNEQKEVQLEKLKQLKEKNRISK